MLTPSTPQASIWWAFFLSRQPSAVSSQLSAVSSQLSAVSCQLSAFSFQQNKNQFAWGMRAEMLRVYVGLISATWGLAEG